MATLEELINKNKIVVFTKSTSPHSKTIKELLSSMKLEYKEVQLDNMGEEGTGLQVALFEKTGQKTLPNTFVRGWHIGGCRYTSKCSKNGTISKMLNGTYEGFHYDVMIIGEGLAARVAALEAATLGMKVALCKPTHQDVSHTTCDPCRHIQRAGLIGTHIKDSSQFGWEYDHASFNWEKLVANLQTHASDLNSACANTPTDQLIKCINAVPRFESANTVELTDKEGKQSVIKCRHFIIASSGSAERLDVPGSVCAIDPDDVFCLPYYPGKVIIIGCSEDGLECAGNLVACDVDLSILIRTPSVEGYDQEMVNKIIDDIDAMGARVYKDGDLQQIDVLSQVKPGEYAVSFNMDDGRKIKEIFNTVVFAVERLPNIPQLAPETIGVKCHKDTGQIMINEMGSTSVDNIFALGGVSTGMKEVTPATRTAKLLVHRLYGPKDDVLSVVSVPSLICSALDYGFVGISEQEAIQVHGVRDVEVYHAEYKPLEYRFSNRFQKCYVKLVCIKSEDEQVVGLHMTGPYAGDVVQGFALAMKLGARRSDFQNLIGIHPTTAEELTGTLTITKSSGEKAEKTEC